MSACVGACRDKFPMFSDDYDKCYDDCTDKCMLDEHKRQFLYWGGSGLMWNPPLVTDPSGHRTIPYQMVVELPDGDLTRNVQLWDEIDSAHIVKAHEILNHPSIAQGITLNNGAFDKCLMRTEDDFVAFSDCVDAPPLEAQRWQPVCLACRPYQRPADVCETGDVKLM